MTKKITKALALTVCAVLLVCGSVLGTMAYLTSKATVSNTFTVGNVEITLDELDTDVYGVAAENASRVESNEYKLIPGHTYTKEATVHVSKESEACYLFVKLDGVLANAEVTTLLGDNWQTLTGHAGVYYYTSVVSTSNQVQDIEVVKSFTVKTTVTSETIANIPVATSITAYAVQADGFNSAAAAWTATFATNQPQTQNED